jgi:hypothetical protein
MFLRKTRGHRRRGRGYQQALRARRARLTPEEVDYLVQATMSKLSKRPCVIAIDRKTTPCAHMFKGIPIYTEEML